MNYKLNYFFFNFVFTQSDLIVLGLYSSNWTDMNIKSKKLILCSMLMNNAYQQKLKFTSSKVVNLAMFTHVRTQPYINMISYNS